MQLTLTDKVFINAQMFQDKRKLLFSLRFSRIQIINKPHSTVPHAYHMKVLLYLHEIWWLMVLYVPLFLAKSLLTLMCSAMLKNAVIFHRLILNHIISLIWFTAQVNGAWVARASNGSCLTWFSFQGNYP